MADLFLTDDRIAVIGIAVRNLRESLRQDPSEMVEDLEVSSRYIDVCTGVLQDIDEDAEPTYGSPKET